MSIMISNQLNKERTRLTISLSYTKTAKMNIIKKASAESKPLMLLFSSPSQQIIRKEEPLFM